MDYILLLVNILSILFVLVVTLLNHFKLNLSLSYYSLLIAIVALTIGMSINLYNHNKKCQEVNLLRVITSGILYSITIFSIVASNYFLKFSGNTQIIYELTLVSLILVIFNYINYKNSNHICNQVDFKLTTELHKLNIYLSK